MTQIAPDTTRRPSRGVLFYLQLPGIASCFAWLASVAALMGWAFGIPALYQFAPGWAAMVPNTAIAVLACSTALWLIRRPNSSFPSRWLTPPLALFATLLGLCVFAEHQFHIDLGIDHLLFSHAVLQAGRVAGRVPGRMSPNTALGAVLLGLALLTVDIRSRQGRRLAPILATVCLLIALIGLVGYIYGVTDLYGVVGYSSMSLPTALSLSMLSIGVWLARPSRGLAAILVSDGAGGAATRLLLPMALLLPVCVGTLAMAGARAGMYGSAFGAALAVTASTCILVLIVACTAYQLYTLDRIRLHYADDLTLQVEESHALAEELEEANALLHEANDRAVEARGAAEEANRVKGEFLAVMSHELRTPLNAAIGYAELLDMGIYGQVTAEQQVALKRIRHSSRHLLGLVNDILNFARVDAGAVAYRSEVVPLYDAVAEMVMLVEPQARANGIVVTVTPPHTGEPCVLALADRDKVQQIMLNLLSNAVKFTMAGGHVTVQCERIDSYATVKISDTGRGITADALERIFEPFVQADPAFRRTVEGTGLGLAVSRTLARGMGGDVTVESTLGVGSVFSLTLLAAADRREAKSVEQGALSMSY